MTAVFVAILSLVVVGIPIVLAVDRRARGTLLLGAAFLYGSGAIFLVLLVLSVLHVHWTLLSVTLAALVVFCAAFWIGRRNAGGLPARRPDKFAPDVIDLLTAFTIVCYGLYATLAPLWEWDFWAIWGLKARTFLEIGGIDWRFLESRWNAFAHPDYPLLVPLNYDFAALLGGGWSDRWLGLFCVAWALALALIARSLAARETTPRWAALLTLTVAALAFSRYVGLAEGAVIAFGGAGVLFIRAGMRFDDKAAWRHGALMLGFAANCKNEGLALLAAVTIATLVISSFDGSAIAAPVMGRRARIGAAALNLVPAYILAVPWLVLRAAHVLPTDIAEGSAASRLLARLPHLHQILALLADDLYRPWFWVAILTGILLAPAVARRRERFVLLVTTIQFLFYLAAYLSTPHDLRWHVLSSWSRLTVQIAVPITFAVFLLLANSVRGGEDAAHAEARPDER